MENQKNIQAEDRLCIRLQGRKELYTSEKWSESPCGQRLDSTGQGVMDVADGAEGDHILGAFTGYTYEPHGLR